MPEEWAVEAPRVRELWAFGALGGALGTFCVLCALWAEMGEVIVSLWFAPARCGAAPFPLGTDKEIFALEPAPSNGYSLADRMNPCKAC